MFLNSLIVHLVKHNWYDGIIDQFSFVSIVNRGFRRQVLFLPHAIITRQGQILTWVIPS